MQFFLSFCIISKTAAQSKERCCSYYDKLLKKKVYTFVDKRPQNPEGESAILFFFAKNFKYPEQDEFETFFLLEFVVDCDGEVIGAGIKDKKDKELTKAENEALRVLRMMPRWIPGKCAGKIVPVLTIIPLRIEPR